MLRARPAIRLECLGRPPREAIDAAARLGATGVQIDARGEFLPEQLSQTGRRHLRHLVESRAMRVAAVGAPTRRGFDDLEKLEARIAYTKDALLLASQLGASIVVNHIGKIPADPADPHTLHFFEALRLIGYEADRVGVPFAILTALDGPEALAKLLGGLSIHGLAIHFDPANVLARGFSPYEGVRTLAGQIAGVQLKDVVRTGTTISGFLEVPLGEGEIRWDEFFGALEDVDYRGWHIVDRESSARPLEDLSKAMEFLKRF